MLVSPCHQGGRQQAFGPSIHSFIGAGPGCSLDDSLRNGMRRRQPRFCCSGGLFSTCLFSAVVCTKPKSVWRPPPPPPRATECALRQIIRLLLGCCFHSPNACCCNGPGLLGHFYGPTPSSSQASTVRLYRGYRRVGTSGGVECGACGSPTYTNKHSRCLAAVLPMKLSKWREAEAGTIGGAYHGRVGVINRGPNSCT